ncbi:RNA polymerase sigma factor [Thalassospira sp.]|uniref:RNA polymerase sigma factor n=1 Tax=Thalassospira sp. TaxID=1912094 RepID=UPI00273554C1|nr:sigma-70 family RNA polymerase sigma factor [Thalassospira sp.]MDP2698377.1 sigma-70 family RNA polymerase sigma factor [Thalassospira sp.]
MRYFAHYSGTTTLLNAFEEQRETLLRLAARKLGNAEEARDVVQDAYVRISGVSSGQVIDDHGAFLRTVVLNLVRDHLRRQNRSAPLINAGDAEDALRYAAADQPSAETIIYQRQRMAAFETALKSLPRRSREVFILRKLHGMSHDEIANQTGLSKAAIEKHLYRALLACRDLMKGYG